MSRVIGLYHVGKRFGSTLAVKDLSLEVPEGEFLTLLGPSGCGKTTTLRLIGGFEIADEGEIWIGDELVNAVPPYRRNVNTVFQNYALFPHLTVFDNIAYGLVVKGLGRAAVATQVMQMLERVSLCDKVRSYPRELSGGQMQRVALARALVNEPRVLLLDEPLGALDAKLRREMQLELKHMQASLGISFVYVTHDQEEALVMSDRIAVMEAGELRQVGTPRDIFERPNSRFVAGFIGSVNLLQGRLLNGNRPVVELDCGARVEVEGAVPMTGPVTVAVRPQHIRLCAGREAARGVNRLRGRLIDVVYAGSVVRLVVSLGGEETVHVESLAERGLLGELHVGREIELHLPADVMLVFPGEEQ